MRNSSIYCLPKFFKNASKLRCLFESRFDYASAKTAAPFVWDYWHVPDEYTLLRTPAYLFFPKKIYEDFHNRLVWWGRRTLGCHDVSPTWLSCYVEGCEQKSHVDLPHGPWAFVYSLTPWQTRRFKGGETFINNNSRQRKKTFELVPAKFNQLLVFDPSLTHGVKKVSGVNDINQGRLVINGWFVNPRPFIEGPLSTNELARQILRIDEFVYDNSDLLAGITGAISFQIRIAKSGKIEDVKPLASTLRSHLIPLGTVSLLIAEMRQHIIKNFIFRKNKTSSLVTLPLIFD